jgi:2-polyprenyl-3-methyl-5-hydroxy-6-metoxy-1,4-benzoquinol methylase
MIAQSLPTAEFVKECGSCGSRRADELYRLARMTVYRCHTCGLAFVQANSPAHRGHGHHSADDDRLGSRYMQEVFVDRHEFWLGYWRRHVSRLTGLLNSSRPRLLDVGCAMGDFMLAAREAGWQTVGVELSAAQVEYAARLGLEVYATSFEEREFEPASFDIVTLWSVIEHVEHPKDMMAKVRGLLRPGGLVVVKTPNQDSLITNLARWSYIVSGHRYMLPVYDDEHIYRFSAQALGKLLQTTGFQLVGIELEDNLRVMLARMHLENRRALRTAALACVHAVAGVLGKQNQLIAYGRAN